MMIPPSIATAPPLKSRACASRNKGNAVFVRDADNLRDLFCGLRKNNDVGFVLEERQRVAFVDEKVGFVFSDGRSAKNLSKSVYDFFLHFWFSCSLTIRICSLTTLISG